MNLSDNSQLQTADFSNSSTAYIGLGSNIGDRHKTINNALNLLSDLPNFKLARVSALIETSPQGGPEGQSNYINGVAEILYRGSAWELLKLLQSVENHLGRIRQIKWGPRTIDLDLLLFDNEIIDKPHLKVPHPLMHRRRFVMAGMTQIAPELLHPGLGRTMRDILSSLPH